MILPLKSNHTVEAVSRFDSRSTDQVGDTKIAWADYETIQGIRVQAEARYPGRDENPAGLKFKTVANSSLVFTYPATLTADVVKLENNARADSKLAPAVALATTYGEVNR